MNVSYDMFAGAFLSKVSEFELLQLTDEMRTSTVDGFLHRAVVEFKKNCKYPITSSFDDDERELTIDVNPDDVDELIEIISEGMVVQWLKPFVYNQENLQNVLNTRDFTMYSPAELLKRVGDTFNNAKRGYTQMIREYSYNHGDLSKLHI